MNNNNSNSNLKTGIVKVPEKTKRDADRSGWLTKEGEKWKTWNRRYFILKDNFLYYFSDPQASEPKGVILLDNCEVGKTDNEKRKFSFYLKSKKSFTDKTGFTDRSYHFQAENEKEMQGWIESLKSATPGKLLPHTQKKTEEISKLFTAIQRGDLSTLRQLSHQQKNNNDISFSLFDEEGNTPLHWACVCGHIECVDFLLTLGDKNIGPMTKSRDGFTAIHACCQEDRADILTLLLTRTANKTTSRLSEHIKKFSIDPNLLNHCNTEDNLHVPLHYAAVWGATEVVKVLISAGAKVNVRARDMSTPLVYACEKGHVEIVKLLVESGAKLDLKSDEEEKGGASPFLLACHHGRIDIATYLINKGVNVKDTTSDGLNALHLTIRSGVENSLFLKTLIENNVPLSWATHLGDTPLHYASYMGHKTAVSTLLTSQKFQNSFLDLKGQFESTSLHFACREGHLEIVKLLVEKGAKLDLLDKDGDTPLNCAEINGHLKVVEYLNSKKG